MNPKLKYQLAALAPSIAIEVFWEKDEDARWDIHDPDLDPDDFQAWQSEVRASAIVKGVLINGSACLAGTWERFGDTPSISNPNISGYDLQLFQEALVELASFVEDPDLLLQIEKANSFLKGEMKERYERQMQK